MNNGKISKYILNAVNEISKLLNEDDPKKLGAVETIVANAVYDSCDIAEDEGYRKAMNEASYEYDRRRGYL